VFGFGAGGSGIPPDWAATQARPGVNLLPDLSPRSASLAVERVRRWRRPGDRVVASIHWGGNWGYAVAREQRELAHRLLDEGVADVVHGHSSHHPKGIEVHRGRLVLHGCGDLLNDYEGIAGYEEFRAELVLAYFATLEPSGELARLELTPFRIRRFRLERVGGDDAAWLRDTLDRECRELGTSLELTPDRTLALRWR
jgi:poly-gamma-glutamate synthesis protein (capsule biosynthesis protein)